jgi:very-short-patch-repair endonuclease
LIIDEASQCDIASAIPLLFRAKRVVVIGDPQQLRHISQLDPNRDQQLQAKHELASAQDMPYTFAANSLFDLGMSVAGVGRLISLREHFRSHFDIIEFSNRQWYGGTLRVCTDYRRLRTVPVDGSRSVSWMVVQGKVDRPRTGGAVSDKEAKTAVAEVVRLLEADGFDGTVGIVTPFRAQANRMKDLVFKELSADVIERAELIVDTAHGFQGDERDVIIFSPCMSSTLSKGARYFLAKTGNLFNVAVSRARSQLLIVGDLEACRASGVPHMQAFAEYYDALSSDSLAPDRDESVGPWELPLKTALEEAGLRPMPQYAEHQYRLDLALVEGDIRLDIEVDGELYHKDWDGMRCRDDVVRDRRLQALGWRVKRFWVYQLRDDLDGCVQQVLELVGNARTSGIS